MPTITIKELNNQYILSVDDWLWLRERIGEPLKVAQIWWHASGQIYSICVYKDDCKSIITVFPDCNGLRFEVHYP